jgi:hypothetical protein
MFKKKNEDKKNDFQMEGGDSGEDESDALSSSDISKNNKLTKEEKD